MFKVKVIDRRSEFSIMSERNLLSKLKHPFIVNMHFAFQDFSKLYLVMDLLSGGDLRYHIAKKKTFTEQETKFFIANLILSLEYIHNQKIIHRDIKPENLVLDSKGYVRLTDFGVAKINEADNSSETSGTPGYMAPEVILIQNHSYPSDFFALGVIGYEFMMGYRPYLGRSRKEIKDLIVSKQAKIKKEELPNGWGVIAAEFINGLLQRKPSKRLGYKNISEIKEHPWMEDIDWDLLNNKELKAPFLPYSNKENFDKEYCEGEEKIGEETMERYDEYIQSEYFEGLFPNYTYVDMGQIINYQKTYNNINNDKINSNNIYSITNYNIHRHNDDNININIINTDKNNRSNLIIKPKNNPYNSSKVSNIKVKQNNLSKNKKTNINNLLEEQDLSEINDQKNTSNSKSNIKILSGNNSKKIIQIKRDSSTNSQKDKEKLNLLILKSDENVQNNNKSKEKKIKRGNGKIDISTIQKFLLKNNNNHKINFNLTKNIFLNKSNSVKMIKNNHKDLIYYNSLIEKKKKEEYITANSSKTKNMGPDIKNIKNNNNNFDNVIVQQYLKNKNNMNQKGLNIFFNTNKLNNKFNIPYNNKKHRNRSQREGEEFKKKIMSWLNNKEVQNDNNVNNNNINSNVNININNNINNKKDKIKKPKNAFLNSNINNNKIYNINTLNKNNNFIINNKLTKKNIITNESNSHEDNNLNFNSNNININITTKKDKNDETIINHYHHPKFNNCNIKKNKLFNYLSNANIHKNTNMQSNKFPFINNINTITNYPKNLLTININDSYSKDLISGKVINIQNNDFLTSNNVRQNDKNIRNIIVNNISPTVNVLIHSEEKNIPKKKRLSNQNRANTINNNQKYNTIGHDNFLEIENLNKKTKKIFKGLNQKFSTSRKKNYNS